MCSIPDELRVFCQFSTNCLKVDALASLSDFCQASPNSFNDFIPASLSDFCQFSPNNFIVSTLDSLVAFSHTSLNLVCISLVAFWICSNTVFQFSSDFEYSCQRESHSFDFSSEGIINSNF